MPRRAHIGGNGVICHVLNRAARRIVIFDEPGDYAAFLRVLGEAQQRVPLRILAYCIMPNHFHLVVWPGTTEELSRFMQWLTSTHSKRWHRSHGTVGTGPLYQGRFKSIPVHTSEHLLAVFRYVERNAMTAGLVPAAERWPWSSLGQRHEKRRSVALHPWPIAEPADWCEIVNRSDAEVASALLIVDRTSG